MNGSNMDTAEKLKGVVKEIRNLDRQVDNIFESLRTIRSKILHESVSDKTAAEVLRLLSEQEEINSSIRQSVNSLHDTLVSIRHRREYNHEQFNDIDLYFSEIRCIEENAAFLGDRIDFLMASAVGFININQNKVIRVFSVVTVIFLLPTLLVSIFGSNIQGFPDIDFWGLFTLTMLSLTMPTIWFIFKGWLRT